MVYYRVSLGLFRSLILFACNIATALDRTIVRDNGVSSPPKSLVVELNSARMACVSI